MSLFKLYAPTDLVTLIPIIGVSQYIDISVYRNTQRVYIVSQYIANFCFSH